MCIRDRLCVDSYAGDWGIDAAQPGTPEAQCHWSLRPDNTCLLYTSDAADERSSVDLGGRRIIKKKITKQQQKKKTKKKNKEIGHDQWKVSHSDAKVIEWDSSD